MRGAAALKYIGRRSPGSLDLPTMSFGRLQMPLMLALRRSQKTFVLL